MTKSTTTPAHWINVHQGTVLSVKRWSDTHISSSGGGGYVTKYGGAVNAPRINSEVVQRVEVHSRTDEGEEKAFDFSGSDVAFREGSRLLAVWGSPSGGTQGPYVHVENLDTGEKFTKQLPLERRGARFLNGFPTAAFITFIVMIIYFKILVPNEEDFIDERTTATLKDCNIGVWIPQECKMMGGTAIEVFRGTVRCRCTDKEPIRQLLTSRRVPYQDGDGRGFIRKLEPIVTGWQRDYYQSATSARRTVVSHMSWLFVGIWAVIGIPKSRRLTTEAQVRREAFENDVAAAVNKAHKSEKERQAAP